MDKPPKEGARWLMDNPESQHELVIRQLEEKVSRLELENAKIKKAHKILSDDIAKKADDKSDIDQYKDRVGKDSVEKLLEVVSKTREEYPNYKAFEESDQKIAVELMEIIFASMNNFKGSGPAKLSDYLNNDRVLIEALSVHPDKPLRRNEVNIELEEAKNISGRSPLVEMLLGVCAIFFAIMMVIYFIK